MEATTNFIARLYNRIFRCPVHSEPISFQLQHDYDSMGQLLPADKRPRRPAGYRLNQMEKAEQDFYAQLRAARRRRYELTREREHHRQLRPEHCYRRELSDLQRWPGWKTCTLQYLYNLFLLYFTRDNGLLDEESTAALCEDLGDRSPRYERRARFAAADADDDGWISFDELLGLLYRADSVAQKISEGWKPERDKEEHEDDAVESARRNLRPLARCCLEKSLQAEALATMSAEDQEGRHDVAAAAAQRRRHAQPGVLRGAVRRGLQRRSHAQLSLRPSAGDGVGAQAGGASGRHRGGRTQAQRVRPAAAHHGDARHRARHLHEAAARRTAAAARRELGRGPAHAHPAAAARRPRGASHHAPLARRHGVPGGAAHPGRRRAVLHGRHAGQRRVILRFIAPRHVPPRRKFPTPLLHL